MKAHKPSQSKWEKNYNMNLGLDLAFIDRIFVTLEYYNRDTKDLLYNRPISATTGFLNYLGNLGQLNNKGVELEVRSLNISNADFNWTTVLNLTHNKNKIVALDGNLDQVVESSWFIRKIGLPFNTFYVKEFAGVDPSSGNALYYKNTEDENGNLDRTLTQDVNEAQAVPYKQVDPKISGGLTNIFLINGSTWPLRSLIHWAAILSTRPVRISRQTEPAKETATAHL